MNILYIDGVGPFGGASRSLFETVRILKEQHGVAPHFLSARGSASVLYNQVAVDTVSTRGLSRFDNTEYSHYRGLRWLVLLRELAYVPFTIGAILRAKSRWSGIDAIHVNEITELIPGLLAKMAFKVPLVVHVRSAQSKNARSWRSRWINRMLRRHVDATIAIDETVRATLPADLPVTVVHNAFTAQGSATPDQRMVALMEDPERFAPGSLKIGFVGNLHVSKGILDLIDAARIVREAGHPVSYAIVGGHTRNDSGFKGLLMKLAGLSQNLQDDVVQRIEAHGLSKVFHLLGPTHDIQSVYSRIDVLCFPSHFDAPGRPIFEAAFSAVPCITCVSEPRKDTVVPGVTGLVVPGRDPQALARAIAQLAQDREAVRQMGENSRQLAHDNFEPAKNAGKVVNLYRDLIDRGSQATRRSTRPTEQ